MKKSKIYFLLIAVILISACGGLNEKQKKSVEDAITALNKINAGTEVGINKLEYSKMLIDAQASVNQASQDLPDEKYSELKQELKLAMEAYSDARTIWNKGGTDEALLACNIEAKEKPKDELQASINKVFVDMCNPEIFQLTVKYQIPTSELFNDIKLPAMSKKLGLTIIWKKAKEHIDRASALLNKNS